MNKIHSGQLMGSPKCPYCQRIIDGFTSLEGEHVPNDGDITICVYCSTILEFEGGGMKFASQDAIDAVDKSALRRVEHVARVSSMLRDPTPKNPTRH